MFNMSNQYYDLRSSYKILWRAVTSGESGGVFGANLDYLSYLAGKHSAEEFETFVIGRKINEESFTRRSGQCRGIESIKGVLYVTVGGDRFELESMRVFAVKG